MPPADPDSVEASVCGWASRADMCSSSPRLSVIKSAHILQLSRRREIRYLIGSK